MWCCCIAGWAKEGCAEQYERHECNIIMKIWSTHNCRAIVVPPKKLQERIRGCMFTSVLSNPACGEDGRNDGWANVHSGTIENNTMLHVGNAYTCQMHIYAATVGRMSNNSARMYRFGQEEVIAGHNVRKAEDNRPKRHYLFAARSRCRIVGAYRNNPQ